LVNKELGQNGQAQDIINFELPNHEVYMILRWKLCARSVKIGDIIGNFFSNLLTISAWQKNLQWDVFWICTAVMIIIRQSIWNCVDVFINSFLDLGFKNHSSTADKTLIS